MSSYFTLLLLCHGMYTIRVQQSNDRIDSIARNYQTEDINDVSNITQTEHLYQDENNGISTSILTTIQLISEATTSGGNIEETSSVISTEGESTIATEALTQDPNEDFINHSQSMDNSESTTRATEALTEGSNEDFINHSQSMDNSESATTTEALTEGSIEEFMNHSQSMDNSESTINTSQATESNDEFVFTQNNIEESNQNVTETLLPIISKYNFTKTESNNVEDYVKRIFEELHTRYCDIRPIIKDSQEINVMVDCSYQKPINYSIQLEKNAEGQPLLSKLQIVNN